jgi:hypothetical protein
MCCPEGQRIDDMVGGGWVMRWPKAAAHPTIDILFESHLLMPVEFSIHLVHPQFYSCLILLAKL